MTNDPLEELRDFLETEYQVHTLCLIANDEPHDDEEFDFSVQLQLNFKESETDNGEPNDHAINALDSELREFLAGKYQLTYFEILDDALTSFLLAEVDEFDQE